MWNIFLTNAGHVYSPHAYHDVPHLVLLLPERYRTLMRGPGHSPAMALSWSVLWAGHGNPTGRQAHHSPMSQSGPGQKSATARCDHAATISGTWRRRHLLKKCQVPDENQYKPAYSLQSISPVHYYIFDVSFENFLLEYESKSKREIRIFESPKLRLAHRFSRFVLVQKG